MKTPASLMKIFLVWIQKSHFIFPNWSFGFYEMML